MFQLSDGIAPQIEVPMNITADSRIAALRPYKSARIPQRIEPLAVPMSATNGTSEAWALVV